MIAFVGDESYMQVHNSADEEEDDDDDEQAEEEEEDDNNNSNNNESEQDESRRSQDDEDQSLDAPQSVSQPSLTPTPESPVHEPSGQPVRVSSPTENQSSNQVSEESLVDAFYESDSDNHIGEQGPALVACSQTKHTYDSDGPEPEVEETLSVADEDYEVVRALDDYHPESEYFSDPDFHDERPGKKSFDEVENERSERRKSLRRQEQQLSGDSRESVDEEVQVVTDLPEDTVDGSEVVEDNLDEQEELEIEVESGIATEQVRGLSEEVNIEDVLPEESNECQMNEDISADNISIESSEHETIQTIRSNDGTSQDITSQSAFANDEVAEIEHTEPIAGKSNVDDNQEKVDSDESSDTIRSVPSAESSSQKLDRKSKRGSEDLNGDVSISQVTASEAKAELFVDESTLAEDVCVSFRLDTFGEKEHDNDENKSNISEGDGDDEATLNDCQLEENTNIGRQASLDDIESEVLDIVQEQNENKLIESKELESKELENKELESKELENKKLENKELESKGTENKELDERKVMLIDTLNTYCDRLVEIIKHEALQRIEEISKSSRDHTLKEMNLVHIFQVESSSHAPVAGETNNIDGQVSRDTPMASTSDKKIYTSSMFYNDQQQSFPTIQQQLERSRTIVEQLESDESIAPKSQDMPEVGLSSSQSESISASSNEQKSSEEKNSHRQVNTHRKASEMFRRRRERMSRFTLESSEESMDSYHDHGLLAATRPRRASLEPSHLSSHQRFSQVNKEKAGTSGIIDQLDDDPANMTDTEYEAPRLRRRPLPTRATTIPFGGRTSRCVKVNTETDSREETLARLVKGHITTETKFKPFLDSSSVQDLDSLRKCSPYGEVNEHNSISPEVCLKLVQDLRGDTEGSGSAMAIPSVVVQPCETKASESIHSTLMDHKSNRGKQLFERRQLQSSDWIVSSSFEAPAEGGHHTALGNQEVGSEANSNRLEESASCSSIASTRHLLSRPSLTEETIMVADERGEQVIELAPMAMSHTQPKLELATVTRTPSFSVSSWRVIECDSPDLLTSHEEDGDESEEETEESEQMNVPDAQLIDDDDDDAGDGNELNVKVQASIAEPETHLLKVVPEPEYAKLISTKPNRSLMDNETNESPAIAMTVQLGHEWSSMERGAISSMEASTARARSQSRSCEKHESTLINWRPQVTTPIWVTTEPSIDYNQPSTIQQHQPTQSNREQIYSSTFGRQANQRCKQAVINSLRRNYQNLINESTSNTYRSYRYPFAEDHDRGRGGSCSLNRFEESFTSQPKVERQSEFEQTDEIKTTREYRQSSEPRSLPTRLQETNISSTRYPVIQENFGEEENMDFENGTMSINRSVNESQRYWPNVDNTLTRSESTYSPHKDSIQYVPNRYSSRLTENSNLYRKLDLQENPASRDVSDMRHEPVAPLRSASTTSQKHSSTLNTKTGRYGDGSDLAQATSDSSERQYRHLDRINREILQQSDQCKTVNSNTQMLDRRCCCQSDHSCCARAEKYEYLSKQTNNQISSGQIRLQDCDTNQSSCADVCSIRICIKLPHKPHQIIIYRSPRVTYAARVDQ